MGLIYGISALHRGTGTTFATETTFTALEDLPDLQAPVAAFPLRDLINNTRLGEAYLDNIRSVLLGVFREVSTGWEINPVWEDNAALREHGHDTAARIFIQFALESFFGSYLRSKVDLTGIPNSVLYYDVDRQNAGLHFSVRLPSLDLGEALRAFQRSLPDASLLELAKRVCDETKFPPDTDLNARLSICCGLILLTYYVEGRT